MEDHEIAARLDKYRDVIKKIEETIASEVSYLAFQLKNESLLLQGKPPLVCRIPQ